MSSEEMGKMMSGSSLCLNWSVIRYPIDGDRNCGDLFFVKNHRNQVLVAAIDGLGHGTEALKASKIAQRELETFTDQSIITLLNNCHRTLRNTRGVVMSLAIFDNFEKTMSWAGVGNVEGILFRSNKVAYTGKENIILRGGVIGYNMPDLKASMISISPGDTLIFTTDGISSGYRDAINPGNPPAEIADYIADNFRDGRDDALVLVARYNGLSSDK